MIGSCWEERPLIRCCKELSEGWTTLHMSHIPFNIGWNSCTQTTFCTSKIFKAFVDHIQHFWNYFSSRGNVFYPWEVMTHNNIDITVSWKGVLEAISSTRFSVFQSGIKSSSEIICDSVSLHGGERSCLYLSKSQGWFRCFKWPGV